MTTDPRAIDAELARVVPPGGLYAVGGRVRDEVRSSLDGSVCVAKDLDYVVTGIELDDLVERLRLVGTADVVGASFAVVKVGVGGTTVDVALARRERSSGTGHREFTIEAGAHVTLEDDLARRDFRMNMLARRVSDGALVDPYGGVADIEARRIDLLRPEAFDEDPLRMLRACQFAARFDYTIAAGTLEAMRAAAPLVVTVSAERVRDELTKFLAVAERPSSGIEWMRAGGVLPYVLPELAEGIGVEQNEFHAYDVYRHNLETLDAAPPGDLVVRLAALLHDVGKPRTKDGAHFYRHEIVGAEMAAEMLGRLRLPNDVIEAVTRLVRHHMYAADPAQEPKTLRRFIRRIGSDLLGEQFALRAADIAGSGLPKRGSENETFEELVWAVVAEKPPLSVRDLAVSGRDVIERLVTAGRLRSGSRGGPIVGDVLSALLERVTDEPGRNERRLLLRDLDDVVNALGVSRETGAEVSRETHEGDGLRAPRVPLQ